MSTSTSVGPKKPTIYHAGGKCETFTISMLLQDPTKIIGRCEDTETTILANFDIVRSEQDFDIAVFRDTEKEMSGNQLLKFFELKDNLLVFVESFRTRGYRFSNEKEFLEWHEDYCLNYDDMQPEQDSINGGLGTIPKGMFPMLEAGYADIGGRINKPDTTSLNVEIGLIFADGVRTKRVAMLLKRL